MLTRRHAAMLLLAPFTALTVAAGPRGVRDDGTMPTATGPVRPADIRQPQDLGREWRPFQARAVTAAGRLLERGGVTLRVRAADRWGRQVAEVTLADGRSLAAALAAAGWALFEDEGADLERRRLLLAAEDEARAARAGIWGAGYRLYQAGQSIPKDDFSIVEGRVAAVARVRANTYINFGADYRSDFTALIGRDARSAFRAENIDPMDFEGTRVRLRGIVEDWNGPLIRLTSPADIECLPDRTPSKETAT